MSARLVVAFGLLLAVGACGVGATHMVWEMVDDVNKRLPEGDRFDPMGWHLTKRLRLHREYRRLYPEGRRLRQLRYLSVAMGLLLLGACWLLFLLPMS